MVKNFCLDLGIILCLAVISESRVIVRRAPGNEEIPLSLNPLEKSKILGLKPVILGPPSIDDDYYYDGSVIDPIRRPSDNDYNEPERDDDKIDSLPGTKAERFPSDREWDERPQRNPKENDDTDKLGDENFDKSLEDEDSHKPGSNDKDERPSFEEKGPINKDRDESEVEYTDSEESEEENSDKEYKPEEEGMPDENEEGKNNDKGLIPEEEEKLDKEEDENDTKKFISEEEEKSEEDEEEDKEHTLEEEEKSEEETDDEDEDDEKGKEDEDEDDDEKSDNESKEDEDEDDDEKSDNESKEEEKEKHELENEDEEKFIPDEESVDDDKKENEMPKEDDKETVDHEDDNNDNKNISQDEGKGFSGSSIFDNPFFNREQVKKYFDKLDRVLGHAFRQEVDDVLILNGTYTNTTEEEVDINGEKYIVTKSLIKGGDNNSSLYVEALSAKPKMNDSKGCRKSTRRRKPPDRLNYEHS